MAEGMIQYRVPLSVAVVRYVKGAFPTGRASRSEFWWALLFSYILNWGVSGVLGGTTLYGCFFWAVVGLLFSLGCRRMHDIGRPGWWCLVPLYNLYLSILPSEQVENKYGRVPNTQPVEESGTTKKIILFVMAVSALVGLVASSMGDNSHNGSSSRISQSALDDDGGIDGQLLSEMILQAQIDQDRRDRYNEYAQAEREKARKEQQQKRDEWMQYHKRKQQIIDDEYQRQRAREGCQNGVPAHQLYWK